MERCTKTGVGKIMVWKGIKKKTPSHRIEKIVTRKFCNHLQSLGLNAKIIEGDENQIALTGQPFDIIKITYYGGGQYSPASRFYVKYGLSCDVNKSNEKQIRAGIKLRIKGIIKKQVLGLSWKGGKLADILNEDEEINNFILQQLLGGVRIADPMFYTPSVSPDRKKGIVWINTTYPLLSKRAILKPWILTPPTEEIDKLMISQKHLNLYNKIADHIRTLF